MRRNAGGHVDDAALEQQLTTDMDALIQKQAEVGIDVGGDGALPRIGTGSSSAATR